MRCGLKGFDAWRSVFDFEAVTLPLAGQRLVLRVGGGIGGDNSQIVSPVRHRAGVPRIVVLRDLVLQQAPGLFVFAPIVTLKRRSSSLSSWALQITLCQPLSHSPCGGTSARVAFGNSSAFAGLGDTAPPCCGIRNCTFILALIICCGNSWMRTPGS